MRTINAPGVEWREIDKSQYTPSMVGTACYVMGFANKGEAYVPYEFTSRSAWQNYYGEPETEAEKYFYNACTEVLDHNGRLYCARLPYDNRSFEKMVAFKYRVGEVQDFDQMDLGDEYKYQFQDIGDMDNVIDKYIKIDGSDLPYTIETELVDEYRTAESTVPPNSFVIVDKTCSRYRQIQEDSRKGKQREMLGIVPVITTAANAMFAQKLITVENRNAKFYETIGPVTVQANENGGMPQGVVQDREADLNGNAKYNYDLVRQLNSCYKNYRIRCSNLTAQIDTIGDIYDYLKELIALSSEIATQTTADARSVLSEINIRIKQDSQIDSWDDYVKGLLENLSAMQQDDPFVDHRHQNYEDYLIDENQNTIQDLANSVEFLYEQYTMEAGWHAEDLDDNLPETVSFEANTFFPAIQYNTDTNDNKGHFAKDHLKKIGVVVYKTYIDPSEGNKIAFEPVEAFVGSLYKNDVDQNTGVKTFIDDIVNTQSEYIYLFSNCFNTPARRKEYLEDLDIFIMNPTDACGSLGFYASQTEKKISINKSIFDGMTKSFEKVSDIIARDIDIIPDAGLANIASFVKALGADSAEYDFNMIIGGDDDTSGTPAIAYWKADSLNEAVKTWKAVEQKLDNFCKNTRKDCMFIADGLRPLVLNGNKKVVRESKPKNTIDANILPYLKYITGLNTSYGAGYLNWFQIADEFTGDMMWLPPSIKAMGIYINTDVNYNYWDAPAGVNRGIVSAVDVAFSPTIKQAGPIYEKNWNYAVDYPEDGITLEGQKTFQVLTSAFDRVNVRRLFLRLERMCFKVARRFIYEGNTAYTRQRFIDTITPYFAAAKAGGGIYDYKIICDESINTPTVIDNNELKVKIGIKPTKTIEFINLDFIATTTGGSFAEAMA